MEPMNLPTVVELVGRNVKAMRERTHPQAPSGEKESRVTFAARLNDSTGRKWTESMLLRIEGTERTQSVGWDEIVDIAITLGVSVFDLVLPPVGKDETLVQVPAPQASIMELPDGEIVYLSGAGDHVTMAATPTVGVDRTSLAQQLFDMPSDVIDKRAEAAQWRRERAGDLEDFDALADQITDMIEQMRIQNLLPPKDDNDA